MTSPAPQQSDGVVHLHIGTMKSGTSYLQHILDEQQSTLAAAGIRYPGDTGRAVNDLLDRRGTPLLADTIGSWPELVADVRAWGGPSVVISMEFLGLASAPQVEEIVQSLRPRRVQVVLTARDIARTLPSAWQQTTKNRGTTSWPDFLRAVLATAGVALAEAGSTADAQPGQQFWRHHDVVAIARRWASVVGAAGVTVVTLPPTGTAPEVLWDRFAQAVGIDSGAVPPIGAGRGNPSIGVAEAELLRRLNSRLEGTLGGGAYRRLVTGVMARRVLRTSADDASSAPLPQSVAAWAHGHGETARAELSELGVRVVGDLDELVPAPPGEADEPAAGAEATIVDAAELARTAVRAAAALVAEIAAAQAQRRQP